MNTIERLINPNIDNQRRSEISLQVSIKETKNLQSDCNYFIEVHLDSKLYAKTEQRNSNSTSKNNKNTSIFWGVDFNLLKIDENTKKVELLVFEVVETVGKFNKNDRFYNTLT